MFGRSSDRSSNEDQRRSQVQPLTPPAGTREAVAVPVSPLAGAGAAPAERGTDQSVVAAEDRIEGKWRTSKGLRILGTVDGSIESASHVYIEEGARVSADVSAEEVVIGGQYSGKLTCRQRLEVRPTGRVSGSIETVKLMLHEGGFVDGELHMQKPADQDGDSRPRAETGGRSTEREARAVGSVRSTVEPSIRQSAAAGGTSGGASTTG
jgi:cytoskeletal protein CcmA (bactofilin family)